MKKLIALLLIAAVMLSVVPAFADSFNINAKVPVSCVGEGGTFAMYEDGREVDRISLKGGEKGAFSVSLTSLDYFEYIIKQVDMNNEVILYDEAEYTVKIVTILNDDDEAVPCITIYDEDGKKLDEIIFRNYAPDVPKTGDENDLFLWAGLAAAAVCGIFVVLILGKRKKETEENE